MKGSDMETKRSDRIQRLPLVATRLSMTDHVWIVQSTDSSVLASGLSPSVS